VNTAVGCDTTTFAHRPADHQRHASRDGLTMVLQDLPSFKIISNTIAEIEPIFSRLLFVDHKTSTSYLSAISCDSNDDLTFNVNPSEKILPI
jgi:hypothetical protein